MGLKGFNVAVILPVSRFISTPVVSVDISASVALSMRTYVSNYVWGQSLDDVKLNQIEASPNVLITGSFLVSMKI